MERQEALITLAVAVGAAFYTMLYLSILGVEHVPILDVRHCQGLKILKAAHTTHGLSAAASCLCDLYEEYQALLNRWLLERDRYLLQRYVLAIRSELNTIIGAVQIDGDFPEAENLREFLKHLKMALCTSGQNGNHVSDTASTMSITFLIIHSNGRSPSFTSIGI